MLVLRSFLKCFIIKDSTEGWCKGECRERRTELGRKASKKQVELQGEVPEAPWTSQNQEDPHNSEGQPEKRKKTATCT